MLRVLVKLHKTWHIMLNGCLIIDNRMWRLKISGQEKKILYNLMSRLWWKIKLRLQSKLTHLLYHWIIIADLSKNGQTINSWKWLLQSICVTVCAYLGEYLIAKIAMCSRLLEWGQLEREDCSQWWQNLGLL